MFNPQALAVQNDINRYLGITADAVIAAQHIGFGQPGATKKSIAMGLIGDALQVTSAVVPGAAPVVALAPQFIQAFSPLVDSIVTLFKHQKHPAFTR